MVHPHTCRAACALTVIAFCAGTLGTLTLGDSLEAADIIEFTQDGVRHKVRGEAVVKAQDGGMLLRGPDDVLWILQNNEIKSRSSDDAPFELADTAIITEALKKEMGEGFSIHTTAHYVIAYNTTHAYARWCGGLYERLHRGFQTYWKGKGVQLHKPAGPMIALVFDSRKTFMAYAKRDLGVDPGSMIGYYNVRTNRVNMYDLTEVGANSAAQIRQLLLQPKAERTVATIVHEATHQLAYNTGLQTRYADNPFWVSEGLAVYFETPDLRSTRGWRGIGAVNRLNMALFRRYAPRRPGNSLETLLSDDSRFRSDASADAYSEAWALNYFLLRRHPKEYGRYLNKLAERTPLVELKGADRLAEFTAAFGPLPEIEQEFMRYMSQVK